MACYFTILVVKLWKNFYCVPASERESSRNEGELGGGTFIWLVSKQEDRGVAGGESLSSILWSICFWFSSSQYSCSCMMNTLLTVLVQCEWILNHNHLHSPYLGSQQLHYWHILCIGTIIKSLNKYDF